MANLGIVIRDERAEHPQVIDTNNYPFSSDQEESKTSSSHTAAHTMQIKEAPVSASQHSSISKQLQKTILEEEMDRIESELPDEEAREIEFCIKGYDYAVSGELPLLLLALHLLHLCLLTSLIYFDCN